jgi:hypothetical protein
MLIVAMNLIVGLAPDTCRSGNRVVQTAYFTVNVRAAPYGDELVWA